MSSGEYTVLAHADKSQRCAACHAYLRTGERFTVTVDPSRVTYYHVTCITPSGDGADPARRLLADLKEELR